MFECNVNIKDVEEFAYSDKFAQFLLGNTTDFSTAAFILQAVEEKLKEVKSQMENKE